MHDFYLSIYLFILYSCELTSQEILTHGKAGLPAGLEGNMREDWKKLHKE